MKWFKHQTDMVDDPKMRRLIRKHGAEGYAVYNLILERIVRRLDSESPLPDLEEQSDDIADMLKMDTIRVEEITRSCIDIGLLEEHELSGRVIAMKVYKFILASETRSEEIRAMIKRFNNVTDSPRLSQTIMKDKDRDTDKDAEKSEKAAYGASQFVELTPAEHAKLVERFGSDNVDLLIASLENYQNRDRYKSHYKTLLKWGQKDNMVPAKPAGEIVEYDYEEDEIGAEVVRRMYGTGA